MVFQVKLNPGSPLQIVKGGVTLRHPALAPQQPLPQPLPPINSDAIQSAYPLRAAQLFGNLQPSLNSPNGISGVEMNYADGPYRNLYKREEEVFTMQDSSEKSEDLSLDINEERIKKKRETDEAFQEESIDDQVGEFGFW